ncbi:MAG: VOC family protein [Anaerolineae bacterium]
MRVENVGITVSDLDDALAFYTRVLPFDLIEEAEVAGEPYEHLLKVFGARLRIATLRLGDEHIQLLHFLAPPDGRPIPPDSRSNDRWFQHIALVVSDMDAAYARLRDHRVQHVSTGPQTLPDSIPAAAGIQAFYFRDPDGHNLELLAYPPGKGDPRWQAADRLFLGIDHTASGVADTEASVAFYTEALGLRVAGESENSGSEQAHLNMVRGAHLRITGLQAASGMGVELLDYLAPADGRPMPADSRAQDLWHWHITLSTSEPIPYAVELPADNPFGAQRSALIRDLDGHALLLIQPKET